MRFGVEMHQVSNGKVADESRFRWPLHVRLRRDGCVLALVTAFAWASKRSMDNWLNNFRLSPIVFIPLSTSQFGNLHPYVSRHVSRQLFG